MSTVDEYPYYAEKDGKGLIVTGPDECAGYILLVNGQSYGPNYLGEMFAQEQVDAHNKNLSEAEVKNAIETGRAVFYLTPLHELKSNQRYVTGWKVSNWGGTFAVRVHAYHVHRSLCNTFGTYVDRYDVRFTGPDGKPWYGRNQGDSEVLWSRRLKEQTE